MQKKRIDKKKALVIGKLAEKYGVSRDFIRQSLRGDTNYGKAEDIKKEFPIYYEKVKAAIDE